MKFKHEEIVVFTERGITQKPITGTSLNAIFNNLRLGSLTTLGCALIAFATLFLFAATMSRHAKNSTAFAIKGVEGSPNFRPIKDIRVGMRVIARNPGLTDKDRQKFGQPAEETWKFLKLKLLKENGTLEIDLIRPECWLDDHGANVGGEIFLEMPELGAVGLAEITEIGPCPKICSGQGEVVISTFAHPTTHKLVDVSFLDPFKKTTGAVTVTTSHPFWSEEHRRFIPIGNLKVGDKVRTFRGEKRKISMMKPHEQSERVYNLEVNGEHVYCVTSDSILVHNMGCGTGVVGDLKGLKSIKYRKGSQAAHRKHFRDFDPPVKDLNDYARRSREFKKEAKNGQVSAQVGDFFYKFDPSDGRTLVINSKTKEYSSFRIANKTDPWDSFYDAIDTGFKKQLARTGKEPEMKMWVEGLARPN